MKNFKWIKIKYFKGASFKKPDKSWLVTIIIDVNIDNEQRTNIQKEFDDAWYHTIV